MTTVSAAVKTEPFKLSYSENLDLDVSAVIVSAGSSLRMGFNKQFTPIFGVPVIVRSMLAFQKSSVKNIVLVLRQEDIFQAQRLANEYGITKLSDIVPGGETRAVSALNGVKTATSKYVLIHDGARPLVNQNVIRRVIGALTENNAVIPVVSVKDTLKRVENCFIKETVDRENLMSAQTPQGFIRELYLKAAIDTEVTDDAQLIQNMSGKVYMVEGDYRNIKITTKEDIILAEFFLKGDSLCE